MEVVEGGEVRCLSKGLSSGGIACNCTKDGFYGRCGFFSGNAVPPPPFFVAVFLLTKRTTNSRNKPNILFSKGIVL